MPINSHQQKEVDEMLEQIGLRERERMVYLALLSQGETTMTPLARSLELPATTVQSILVRLTTAGLVATTKRKSRHAYEAYDPIVIQKILERQIQEAKNVIPLLQTLQGNGSSKMRIRIFHRERMTDIFHEALETNSGIIHEIVAAKEFQKIIGEKFHFTRRRVQRGVHLKSLRVESQEIKKYSAQTHIKELREAKFLPKELSFTSQILFWDDTIAFFGTAQEGLAWIVQSHSLRETMQQLFDLLWSISRRMETSPE